jgi:coenzyme F420-0:L-glutamate ligase/coenzyme F420-1:gamma-L-glutamate ligase
VASLSARGLSGIPEVRAGDDLAALILAALDGLPPTGRQVVAIAHTAVSKAEAAVVALGDITPGERARELAAELAAGAGEDRDPRLVQVVLDQSSEVLRAERGVLICRTRHGLVCANAGVDVSNAASPDTVIVLPRDPDASARRIRARLRELIGRRRPGRDGPVGGRRAVGDGPVAPARSRPGRAEPPAPAVLISDSFGRAWRHGQTDVAVGLAGMQPLDDWRGRTDASGLELRATWLAVADAAAAVADLARTKASREPVVVIDGLERFVTSEDGPGAAALVRPLAEDLFR